jgi:Flp pilus assembly protein TadD
MKLQLETTTGGHPVASAEKFTLVLSGLRNDLAHHRALAFLQQRLDPAPASLTLPFTVLSETDFDTGTSLANELNGLGAIVRLNRCESACVAPAPAFDTASPPKSSPTSSPRFSAMRVARMLGLAFRVPLLIILAVAVSITLRMRNADQVEEALLRSAADARAAAPKPDAAKAAAASAQASNGQIKSLMAQGDSAAALRAIERALETKEEPALLALKGEVCVKMSNWEAARVAYERAVTLESKDPQVFLGLAGIYRQQGRQNAAVDMLHKAKEYGAGGSEFQSLVSMVVAEQDAEADFGSVSTPHFTISFDEAVDQAEARRVLSHLEDAYLSVGQKLDEYPTHRTPVVLYSAQDFQEITHAPGWAGALYDGRIKVPVRGPRGRVRDLAKAVRHEYTHALIVSMAGARCPVWLNEGVAMWAEDEKDGEREDWALGAINMGQRLNLTQLENSFVGMSGRQAVSAYAQSYLAVRHIVARYGQLPLQKLVRAFAASASTAQAFREALSVELSTFEDELRFDQDGVG